METLITLLLRFLDVCGTTAGRLQTRLRSYNLMRKESRQNRDISKTKSGMFGSDMNRKYQSVDPAIRDWSSTHPLMQNQSASMTTGSNQVWPRRVIPPDMLNSTLCSTGASTQHVSSPLPLELELEKLIGLLESVEASVKRVRKCYSLAQKLSFRNYGIATVRLSPHLKSLKGMSSLYVTVLRRLLKTLKKPLPK